MTAKWGICIILLALVMLAPGCRTPAPDLRPKDLKKEEIVEPPPGWHTSPEYPKAAFSPPVDPSTEAMNVKPGDVPNARSGGMGGLPGR